MTSPKLETYSPVDTSLFSQQCSSLQKPKHSGESQVMFGVVDPFSTWFLFSAMACSGSMMRALDIFFQCSSEPSIFKRVITC